ncbi:MAG TPA: MarR family transcriptional regulator [Edaphobacter sp.]|nr:MarR family transcriptional regulator [Edaphobacter sp.]
MSAVRKNTKRRGAIALPCLCANLRRAARVVTQMYDEALRPSGLRAPQFALLQALSLAPGISQKGLARVLAFDSTTLTRTLDLMRKKSWVRSEIGEDRRELRLFLTEGGLEEYKHAMPYWQLAQKRLKAELGEAGWSEIERASMRVADLAALREG